MSGIRQYFNLIRCLEDYVRLARITTINGHQASSSRYVGRGNEVWVGFNRFGKGYERRSDFAVYLNWRDVEALIERFDRQGHPKALAMKNAIRSA